MGNDKIQNWPAWLRWSLAYPVALIGSVLLAWIVRLLQSIFMSNADSWFFDLMQTTLIGFLFVFISSWFAPKYIKIVSLISLGIVIAITFFLIGFVLLGQIYGTEIENPIMFYLSNALMIAGAIFAVVNIHQSLENSEMQHAEL